VKEKIYKKKEKFKVSLFNNNLNETIDVIKQHQEFFVKTFEDEDLEELIGNKIPKNSNIKNTLSLKKNQLHKKKKNSDSDYKLVKLLLPIDNRREEKVTDYNEESSFEKHTKNNKDKFDNSKLNYTMQEQVSESHFDKRFDKKEKRKNNLKIKEEFNIISNEEDIDQLFKKKSSKNNQNKFSKNKAIINNILSDSSCSSSSESEGNDLNFYYQNKTQNDSESNESYDDLFQSAFKNNKSNENRKEKKVTHNDQLIHFFKNNKNNNLNNAFLFQNEDDSSKEIEEKNVNKSKSNLEKNRNYNNKSNKKIFDGNFEEFFVNNNVNNKQKLKVRNIKKEGKEDNFADLFINSNIKRKLSSKNKN